MCLIIKRYFNDNKLQIIPFDIYVLKIAGCKDYDSCYASISYILYRNNKAEYQFSRMIDADDELSAYYHALIFGLRKALSLNVKHLFVETNNKLLVEQMNLKLNCNNEKIFKLHDIVFEEAIKFDDIYFKYISNTNNKEAYVLALDKVKNYINETKKHLLYIDDILVNYEL